VDRCEEFEVTGVAQQGNPGGAREMIGHRYKPTGWRGEPHRHYLAAKGVTTKRYFYTPTYGIADLAPIGVDAIGTAGAAGVAMIPLVVPAAMVYGGAKYIKKKTVQAKAESKKRKYPAYMVSKHDVFNRQIRMGTKVEMEHTKNPAIARKIAMDHLGEDPRYYDKLKIMESSTLSQLQHVKRC
jgi:hypothetical protein